MPLLDYTFADLSGGTEALHIQPAVDTRVHGFARCTSTFIGLNSEAFYTRTKQKMWPEWGVGEAAIRQICVKATIDRYKKASSDTSNSGTVAEVNAQFAILGEPGVLYGEAKQQPTTRPVTPDEGTTTH